MKKNASPSIQVTRYTDRSFTTRVAHTLLHLIAPILTRPPKPFPPGSPRLNVPSNIRRSCNACERQVEDIWIYDLTSKPPVTEDGDVQAQHQVYCIAGGSFRMPPSPDHWRFYAYLATHLPNTIISIISPPLAPKSPAPETFPHLVHLFQILLLQASSQEGANKKTTFLGDSSGGNLVLSLVLSAFQKSPSLPPPQSIFLLCPSADLRHSNPKIRQLQKHDPLLRHKQEVQTSKDWAGGWSLDDPRVSPLLADLSILADRDVIVQGVTAGYDILTPDALLLREKLEYAGVGGEWLDWDKQMHCFPLAFTYRLSESISGLDWIVEVLKKDEEAGLRRR
ncbi:MAG: hypothetical protein Q9190_004737 [Brigantiaea leucoxantha]